MGEEHGSGADRQDQQGDLAGGETRRQGRHDAGGGDALADHAADAGLDEGLLEAAAGAQRDEDADADRVSPMPVVNAVKEFSNPMSAATSWAVEAEGAAASAIGLGAGSTDAKVTTVRPP
jgi:hypothetical protein